MNIKSMAIMVVFGVSVAASVAMAGDKAAQDPAVFQAMKDQHVANLQERLQIVQTHLSCVQAAQDGATMKACKDAAKQQNDALDAKVKVQKANKKTKSK